VCRVQRALEIDERPGLHGVSSLWAGCFHRAALHRVIEGLSWGLPSTGFGNFGMLPPSTDAADHTQVEHVFVFFLSCLVLMLAWEVITWVQANQRPGCGPDNCKHVLQMD